MKIVNYSIISAIKLYQFFISPFFLSSCRYQPTCSEYFIDKKTQMKKSKDYIKKWHGKKNLILITHYVVINEI